MSRVLLVGAGSVGRGWAALLLAKGYQVVVQDPAVREADIRTFIQAAWPALARLGIATGSPDFSALSFAEDLEAGAIGADLAFENGPENVADKQALIGRLDALLPSDRLILSSSGGIRPTLLQARCAHPERVLVAHPFNPPHLVPLVEIVGGERTDPGAIAWTRMFLSALGKRPIVVKREMAGHLANRFQAALMREVFHCLVEEVASPQDIDDALRFGLGPRWALMGGLMTFNLAGGAAGAMHTLELAGDAYSDWWADLGDVALTPDVREKIVAATHMVEGAHDRKAWMAWRDEGLVDVIEIQNRRIGRQ